MLLKVVKVNETAIWLNQKHQRHITEAERHIKFRQNQLCGSMSAQSKKVAEFGGVGGSFNRMRWH